jgi:predicted lipoprotein with Yx(FWY)xxD motif
MRRYAAHTLAALAALALLAGCGSSSKKPASTSSASSSSSSAYGGGTSAQTQTAAAATVKTGKVKLGTIVVDGSGHTLYLFEGDKGTTSTCNDACAKVWAPLTTGAAPQAGGDGIDASLLGTTKRADGTMQVTYASHPLYHYDDDHNPGQAEGQGEKAFGADWYVLAPSGKKIDES